MPDMLINIAGWVPAVVLPAACLLQLIHLIKTKRSEGVSAASWVLFGIANICLYIFAEKYTAPQSLLGLLGTAVVNFSVAGMVFVYRAREQKQTGEIIP